MSDVEEADNNPYKHGCAPFPLADVCLGEGNWLDGFGTYEGMPAVMYEPSPAPGPVGEKCTLDLVTDTLLPGAVVLRFSTREAVYQHINLLMQMLLKSSGTFAEKPADGACPKCGDTKRSVIQCAIECDNSLDSERDA